MSGVRERRRWRRTIGSAALIVCIIGTLLFLWVARTQAIAMLHYTRAEGAKRTARPEQLSVREKIKVVLNGVSVPRPENSTDPNSLRLPFETLDVINGRGDTLEVWRIPFASATVSPSAPRVLMFHGYAASKDSLLSTALQFQKLGCECWLVDFYGSGGSTGDSTSFGWYESGDVASVASAARAADEPLSQKQPLVLYGTSMGGSAIMRALADLDVDADGAIVESVFGSFRETVAKRFQLMHLPAFPAADLLLWFGGRELGFDALQHNPIDYASRIDTPVLLLHGRHDTRATIDQAEAIHAALVGPATLVDFDAGHQMLAPHLPKKWREAVRTFLGENTDPSLPVLSPTAVPQ